MPQFSGVYYSGKTSREQYAEKNLPRMSKKENVILKVLHIFHDRPNWSFKLEERFRHAM